MGRKTFLDRWSGRPTPTPEVTSALADLERLGLERPELLEPARTLGSLMVRAFEGTGPVAFEEVGWQAMRGSWSRGEPSFHAFAPPIDGSKLASRLRSLLEVLGPGASPARAFSRAIGSGKLGLTAWVAEILAGRPDEVIRRAEGLAIDPTLATSMLRLALLPDLAKVSALLDGSRPEGAWDRGDCPHCGARPLLAESRGLEQSIHLRCGLCAADWPGKRLGCPSCGETSSKALHHSFVEGEQERFRLAHCDACRYDWKVVSTLTALSPPAMIVAELATVHLDWLAADRREGLPSG